MLDDLSALQIWLLIGGAAVVGFFAGHASSAAPSETRARFRKLIRESALHDFELLTGAEQAEVDRLAAGGNTVEAEKIVQSALQTGLYHAHQIVDQRKRLLSQR